jgi:putative nucleotidyltransferase with HDIG domain
MDTGQCHYVRPGGHRLIGSGLWYRIKQFWRAWFAPELTGAQREAVQSQLTAPEYALFCRFDGGEQWHSYQVMCTLKAAGHIEPDLLAAALLHDVGKTQSPLSVWDRSLIVVMKKAAPGKTAVWGQGSLSGWQRPFVVKAQHPEWGAQMAEAAGSSQGVVSLIRRHQDELPETAVTAEDNLLRLLQWADDQH